MKIELGKNIATRDIETRIQKFWDENSFWENDVASSKPAFCTMMPPPNITGSLHMGHALDNVLTDIICRYKRMDGFDVLWQPGTDHASIATQLLVERNLSKNGINPRGLSKEGLLVHAYKWKEEYGGQIISQLHTLGVTPAWNRDRFTMDNGLSRAVTKLFVKMYNEGLIYKARRLVNWCPKQQTTISDLEIETKDEKGFFYFFKYPLIGTNENSPEYIEIATTRPETLFGDQAIAIHPDNEKLKHLIGRTAVIPMTDIEIPVIANEHADPDKGTGAVKITPAHDMDDWEVGKRHNLNAVSILTPDAKMADMPQVPEKYRGMDRHVARKEIVADLTAAGLITKIEDKTIPTPYSERGNCVVEYMVRDEWFVDAKKLSVRAIDAASNGDTKFSPEHRLNLYMAWMKDIHEWSISRQLWWGHQIPAWYDEDGRAYVAESEEEAYEQARKQQTANGKQQIKLIRDESCLDTWFSSALWPFSTLGWPDDTPELKKYYPTDLLVTGTDLIFFWVARMMMMGIYAMNDIPFRVVDFHGMVRDSKGQKMSKTKGNGTDPLEVIEKYGADALRYWVATTPIGQDVRYSEDEVKRGSKLLTKLWNAAKYMLMQLDEEFYTKDIEIPAAGYLIEDRWVMAELNKTIAEVRRCLDKYDTYNARAAIDSFFYDIFCDQYLEFIKERFWSADQFGAESKHAAQNTLWRVFNQIIKMYAPFVPFITEELFQKIYMASGFVRNQSPTIHLESFPKVQEDSNADVSEMQIALDILKAVRGLRTDRKIGNGARLSVVVVPNDTPESLFGLIKAGARAESVEFGAAIDFVVKQND